jgi:hypothetical protein
METGIAASCPARGKMFIDTMAMNDSQPQSGLNVCCCTDSTALGWRSICPLESINIRLLTEAKPRRTNITRCG